MRTILRVITVGSFLFGSLFVAGSVYGDNIQPPLDNAQFVSADLSRLKASYTPGESISMSITAKNTGTSTWDGRYALWPYPGNSDEYAWTTNSGLGLPRSTVNPGETVTFNLQFFAPQTPQTVALQWRMSKDMPANTTGADQSKFFGDPLPSASISFTAAVPQPQDNAQYVTGTFPTKSTFTVGESVPIQISVKNTGTHDWVADSYALAQMDRGTYYPIDHTVKSGETYNASFSMSIPTTLGSFTRQWRMVSRNSGQNWTQSVFFGDPLPSASLAYTVVNTLQDNAQSVGGTLPSKTTFIAGENIPISIIMSNTGTSTWKPGEVFLAGNASRNDSWTGGSTVRYPLNQEVAPGQQNVFSFSLTAPTGPLGTGWLLNWNMVRLTSDGKYVPFGALAPSGGAQPWVIQQAVQDNAQLVSTILPSKNIFAPGETFTVQFTMRNTGTSTWKRGEVYLGGTDARNTDWMGGSSGWYVVDETPPQQNYTFTLNLTAPQQVTGSEYRLQWQMGRRTSSTSQTLSFFGDILPSGGAQPWVVKATTQNTVIQTITSPSTLKPGEQGTWTVQASDPMNNTVGVAVDYGDGGMGILSSNGTIITSGSTATFTHSYTTAGTYRLHFTASGVASGDKRQSDEHVTVVVSAPTTPSTQTCPPDCPSNPATTTLHPDGSLIKLRGTKGIYLIDGGMKRPIPSRRVFDARGFSFDDVEVVERAEFNTYPQGSPVTIADESNTNSSTTTSLQEGSLVKALNEKAVYRIENAKKRPFLSGSVFEAKGYYWSDIVVVKPDVLSAYPLGDVITYGHLGDGFLIKSPRDPSVYWTADGQKQHIANEAVFAAHAFRWQDIHIVSDDEIATYPTGPDMSR